ncbi:hypothetical protein PILCRDRAFT_8631 [Piloderma croceum F 1598]|uniref:C2H2-type domain-containing protein n=1 Tax=Piloderma croceum (strain F 1598) TaxID=765440 RepID=A0A0C3FAB7_PILCF|nr:hypothetical protein PILCRDRAFT_8631 [Piloderma croceum F 1598]
MKANNNLPIHNIHTLRRPEPVLPCLAPGCIRRFYNRSGRTSHMHSQHPEIPPGPEEPQPLSPHNPLSHQSSPNDDDSSSSRSGDHAMPGPASTSSRSLSEMHGEDDASQGDVEMGFDPPWHTFDGDDDDGYHETDGERSSSSHHNGDCASYGQARDAFVQPHVTKEYHPSINGTICDEDRNDIPPDTPPPPHPTDRGPNDWTPYNNRVEFEVADFLYRRNQICTQ